MKPNSSAECQARMLQITHQPNSVKFVFFWRLNYIASWMVCLPYSFCFLAKTKSKQCRFPMWSICTYCKGYQEPYSKISFLVTSIDLSDPIILVEYQYVIIFHRKSTLPLSSMKYEKVHGFAGVVRAQRFWIAEGVSPNALNCCDYMIQCECWVNVHTTSHNQVLGDC